MVVMTLVVRNEADIISPWYHFHNSQGVEHFIITDNGSDDGTYEKLLEFSQKKGNITLIQNPDTAFRQAAWVTEMARRAATEFNADWVINNDADEFWYIDKGTLKEYFDTIDPSYGTVYPMRFDFVFRPYGHGIFYEKMPYREKSFRWAKCCHRGFPDVRVDHGNHNAFSDIYDQKNMKSIGTANCPINILHFPIRSYEGYRVNIKAKYERICRDTNSTPDIGWHWRIAGKKIEEGKFDEYFQQFVPSMEMLTEGICAGRYVIDERLMKYFWRLEGNKRFI